MSISSFNASRTAFVCVSLLSFSGCARVPSPLTPNVRGSVGLPHYGYLSDSQELPAKGPGFAVLDPNGHHFGTPSMLTIIKYAAGRVAQERPGAPLLVGDISAKSGGELPRHRSHRTGRDADLLLLCTDLSGRSIRSPGWIHFGPDGLGRVYEGKNSGSFVALDVGREWLLVKSLVQAPDVHPLWFFLSRPVEALLTQYALANGEDPLTVWEAENMMLQPANSLPHDDHIHLRIACSADEAVNGCEDGGPSWPWLPPPPSLTWPLAEENIVEVIDATASPQ
jgi:penicillin-insensitive murein endopeptidase